MIDRLLRVENLVVVPLLLVAVAVALGARWRDDPRRAGTARALRLSVRVGLAILVALILLFAGILILVRPIGP